MTSETFEKAALDCYDYCKTGNITESGVLMVTITLKEYRDLVAANAKHEQKNQDKSNWELQKEIDQLKAQIVRLTMGEELED